MANFIEQNGTLKVKNKNGQTFKLYPKTKVENVIGLGPMNTDMASLKSFVNYQLSKTIFLEPKGWVWDNALKLDKYTIKITPSYAGYINYSRNSQFQPVFASDKTNLANASVITGYKFDGTNFIFYSNKQIAKQPIVVSLVYLGDRFSTDAKYSVDEHGKYKKTENGRNYEYRVKNAHLNDINCLLFLNGEYEAYDLSGDHNAVQALNVAYAEGKYYDSRSFKFDGSTNALIKVGIDPSFINSDFTIDWWEYRDAKSVQNGGAVFQIVGPGGGGIVIGREDQNGKGLGIFASSTDSETWDSISATQIGDEMYSEWVHRAIVRSNNTIRAYQNGILYGSAIAISNPVIFKDGTVYVGARFGLGSVNGKIDNFRITKGVLFSYNFGTSILSYDISETTEGWYEI